MKKLKLFKILLLTILFIPSTAFAATQTYSEVATRNFSSANTSTIYYIGSGNPYKPSNGSFRYTYFHSISDGGTTYLAYCLDDGLHSPYGAGGNITNSDSSELYNKFGTKITGARLTLLKNILAAGQQYVGSASSFVNSSSTQQKDRYLATQILVWEVMDGARSDYAPGNLNSPSPTTYDFVKTDSQLKTQYEKVLSDASKLADANKPAVFGKTYTLHWNDGFGYYTLNGDYNIGNYQIDSYDTSKISVEKSNNNILVTTTKELSTPTTINFKLIQGNTSNSSNKLRWFIFNDTSQRNQKMLLAYYQGSNTGNLSVKTESGKFKITKKDSSTKKNIKGAVFELDKCTSNFKCDKVGTIDMKDKEVSSDITIKKSGFYKLREVTVPFGYEKIPDIILLLSISDDGKVSAQYDSSYNVEKNSATDSSILNLIVYNEAKNFNIKKVDGRNEKKEIKGAAFQIKKLDGTVVKFKKEADGKYTYDANGSETRLVSANLSNYKISLLPEGEYILEELSVPYPYVISSKQVEKEIKFKIDKTDYLKTYNYTTKQYVKDTDLTITAKNFETRVTIIKTGLKSKVIPGVTFELYDSNKQNQVPLRIENGQYIYNQGGSPIQLVTDSNGKIVINYLKEGTYYLKEVRTPENSGLSIDENNQWTKLDIYVNRTDATPYNYSKEIRNAKGSFCFYKIDEDGNYLDSGKFKLQMYNEKTSKYEDKSLIFNTDKTYSIDTTSKSDIYTFSPISSGQTCFVDIDAKGKYRVVELEAPEGFVLPNASETTAEIVINEYGYATGDAVIINKKLKIGEGAEAQAELIINIQTGQNRVHYVIIISSIVLVIAGLIIIKKKIDKK